MKHPRKTASPGEAPRRRKPEISAEDHALWVHVTRSARPLPGRKPLPLPELVPELLPKLLPKSGPRLDPAPARPKPPALLPLAGIEKRMVRDIARGRSGIDGRIDLHGMRQAEAHQALLAFLHRAHHEGAKLVLVITGKGGGLDPRGEERGVLRRLVPHWLADPVLRRLVIGFEQAARGHGGEGALYVRLRRRRAE